MVQAIVAAVAGLTLVAFWAWRLTQSDVGYTPPTALQIACQRMSTSMRTLGVAMTGLSHAAMKAAAEHQAMQARRVRICEAKSV